MTSKRFRTVGIEKSQYLNYRKKAEEFYRSMLQAERSELWNAAGLNAVHCAISITDALLVKFRGIRSIGDDHRVVVDLIRQELDIEGIESKTATLQRILAKKALIEYDNTVFTRSDAAEIVKQTERFYLWASEQLLLR